MFLNPFATYMTSLKCKNVKNLFVSLLNTVISYDCQGYGIPYMSSVQAQGEVETLTTLSLHVLIILIEYKPPSLDNLKYLIQGGHPTLKKVYQAFQMNLNLAPTSDEQLHEQVLKELTVNEHQRMFKVMHGRINMDPLFNGLIQYFKNVINV